MKSSVTTLLALGLAAGTMCGTGASQEGRREGVGSGSGVARPPAGRAEDERAIREMIDGFTGAFRRQDSKAIADLFAEDGEAIDVEGGTIQGRRALEQHYAARIAEAPGDQLETSVERIAFLAPGIARVTGRTQLTPSDG